MQRFMGKVAIVFGGSRGIGRAVAERLGRDGASVLVNYVSNGDAADGVVAAITAAGGQAMAAQGDVAQNADVLRIFDAARARWAKVDVVINAAGVPMSKPTAELLDEDYERIFGVNARGAMNVLRAAATRVADNGRVIHVSSGATRMPRASNGIYMASKAAGEQFTLALAREMAPRGVTVNIVSPGATKNDAMENMPEAAVAHLVNMTPLGRLGQPDDVGDAVALLASEDARWITGQNIQVNGGIL